MRMRYVLVLSVFFLSMLGSTAAAQSAQTPAETRRVVRRASPVYPEIAKRMNLSGTVRVQATVLPDGTVKSVQPVGGSPVLLQAAEEAVNKWKFAAAGAESKELIEMKFDPQ